MNGKKEFPNNWKAIKDAPHEWFEGCSREEFEIFKLNGWQIPSSIECIIRAEHKETGKITEHCYRRAHAAQERLIKYLKDGEHILTVCNEDSIHLLKTTDHDTDDD